MAITTIRKPYVAAVEVRSNAVKYPLPAPPVTSHYEYQLRASLADYCTLIDLPM
ncbi:MAG: hypothetical protein WBG73_11660 [Coleofasciculaceae cyanobacterium]